MLKWDDNLKVGVVAIDAQHKELYDKINDLLAAMSTGKGKTEILSTLSFLETYVIKHFSDEEKLQVNSKYPGYNVQKKEHEAFKKRLADLKSGINNNTPGLATVLEVQKEMNVWWTHHITVLDMELGKYLRTL